jgi:branched-chain amino acid aminotransferase
MANIDWDNLSFEYQPTKSNIRYTCVNGKWGEGRFTEDFTFDLHIAATCIHYGQACFEGLKAFTCKDGKIRIFRPDENAKRLSVSSQYMLGPEIPEELFIDAVKRVTQDNIEYVPPYGTGGALYIRPVLIGTTPRVGISPSDTYELIIMVMPVGPYYKGGIKPVDALIMDDFDRAAPLGTGHVKVAGNYAAGLTPAKFAKDKGFPINLFLDAKYHQFIDEFGTSNFIAITKDGKYVTPNSSSTLPSITNKSLMQLAEDMGMTIEKRPISLSELSEFAEIGACGTAVVITPIKKIVHGETTYTFGNDTCAPTLQKLYDALTAIHKGEAEDKHGWMVEV